MRALPRPWIIAAAALTVALGSLPLEAADASRTRGGGGSKPTGATRTARSAPSAQSQGRSATRPRPGAPAARAQGKATWRQGRGHVWWHSPSPWLGWGWNLGWDWWGPYDPYGYYGYYGYYGSPYGPPVRYPGWGPDVEVVGEAWVETDVRPKRARVLLDGEDVGTAKDWNGVWDRLPVEPGAHQLEFVLDGHQTLQVHLDARAGRIYHVDRELRRGEGIDPRSTREPPRRPPRRLEDEDDDDERDLRGHLRWSIEPGDAAVYLDGRFLGRASDLRRMQGTRSLPAGEHELEVVRPGFRSERRRVLVEADDLTEVRIELEREEEEAAGELEIED